jgi:hypothetical protein
MMAEHGGYRKPSNPAPVSGPGKMSARTDGQPAQYISGLPYGDGQAMMDLQRSAPMAAASTPTPTSTAPTAPPVTPMGAATERPDEPVTAGSPFGPGPGPSVVPSAKDDPYLQLRAALPTLLKLADLPTTSPVTRNVIRYLRGTL